MTFTITAKELRSLFASPLAWVVLAFLQGVFAWIFMTRIEYFLLVQAELSRLPSGPGLTEIVVVPVFGIASIVLLMSMPLLTMRLIAEERRNRTITFLLSAPVSVTEIVMGKFLAMVIFLVLISSLIFLMALSLLPGGNLDFGLLISSYIGLTLLGASFAAIGLFVSCLTDQPVVAAVLSLGAGLGLWMINIASSDPESPYAMVSLLAHFEPFMDGSIAVKNILYFVLLIGTFLILSVRRLDADRLSK